MATVAWSQSSVQAPTARIDRAKIYNLPVIGSLPSGPITELKLLFYYDARIIDIKSASGSEAMAIEDIIPNYTSDYKKIDSTFFIVIGNKVKSVTNDTLCMLQIEGLAFSDSIAYIKPYQIWINGNFISNTQFTNGRITVNGSSILPNFPDNFGYGYKNPFDYSISFDFNLEKSSKAEFLIFTISGGQVVSSKTDPQMFTINDEINGKHITNMSQILDKGSYTMTFTPDETMISSGLYIIVMKTDRSVYNRNFIYIK
jgi:hypothetical protein